MQLSTVISRNDFVATLARLAEANGEAQGGRKSLVSAVEADFCNREP